MDTAYFLRLLVYSNLIHFQNTSVPTVNNSYWSEALFFLVLHSTKKTISQSDGIIGHLFHSSCGKSFQISLSCCWHLDYFSVVIWESGRGPVSLAKLSGVEFLLQMLIFLTAVLLKILRLVQKLFFRAWFKMSVKAQLKICFGVLTFQLHRICSF